MRDPKEPSENTGGKVLEFKLKNKLISQEDSPLDAMVRETQTEEGKILREIGLRLLQRGTDYKASILGMETPADWESQAQALEKEKNWLVLIAHCHQWAKDAPNVLASTTLEKALAHVEPLAQHLRQYDPKLADKLMEFITSSEEEIGNGKNPEKD